MARVGKQHVFVVDDESSVRKVVAKTLERLGVEVTCFARATDCLEQLGQKPCDLLITDVKMPEMDGINLLEKAKRIAPWLPVLVGCKGYEARRRRFYREAAAQRDFFAKGRAHAESWGVS